jgi:type III secretory pathway component EscS
MGRILRDIIVAVVGGTIVSLIAAFTTNLSRTELAGVFALALVACGLILGAAALLKAIKKRYDRWLSDLTSKIAEEVSAETVRELLLGDDDTLVDTSLNRVIAGGVEKVASNATEPTTFQDLLIAGRMAQAKTLQYEIRSTEIHGDLAMEMSQWEGRARAALLSMPELLSEFGRAPGYISFGISAADAYKRLDNQLAVLEEAIQGDYHTGAIQLNPR